MPPESLLEVIFDLTLPPDDNLWGGPRMEENPQSPTPVSLLVVKGDYNK